MNDQRKGKPSASGVERLALCPGSWNLERKLPPEPESDDAAAGTRIHDALNGDESAFESLSLDETSTYGTCRDLEAQALYDVFGDGDGAIGLTLKREQRLWLGDSFSGQYDFLAILGSKALALDYKTGRGEVESAEGNLQLRALAVLVAKEHPELEEITVGIVQPWVSPQVSLCRYGRGDIRAASVELHQILDASNDPDAKRIPGEKQCKYCKAVGICPEARNTAMTAFEAPEQSVALLTPDELGDYLGRIALVETVIDALKAEAKSRLEKGEQVTGWRLKPGSEKSTVTDPQALFNRFSARGGTVPQFMRAITVAKGKFKEVFKEVTQIKGKDLDKAIESMMDGIVEIKINAPSLERVKD